MKKIRAAVVGYGNIGKFTIEALEASADFEIAGIVRRNGAADKPAEQPAACGAADKPAEEKKPAACGAACGAGDK